MENTHKSSQIPSYKQNKQKEKTALRNLNKSKDKLIKNDTRQKIWIATDVDKNDASFECIKKLNVVYTYYKEA